MTHFPKLALMAVALVTIVSGAAQLFAPAFVLRVVGGEITSTTSHLFAVVGMFMMLFGALMWQAVRATPTNRTALLWTGLQKFGAAFAVGIAIIHGLFAPIAAAVALFDFGSGILALWYWNRMSTT